LSCLQGTEAGDIEHIGYLWTALSSLVPEGIIQGNYQLFSQNQILKHILKRHTLPGFSSQVLLPNQVWQLIFKHLSVTSIFLCFARIFNGILPLKSLFFAFFLKKHTVNGEKS